MIVVVAVVIITTLLVWFISVPDRSVGGGCKNKVREEIIIVGVDYGQLIKGEVGPDEPSIKTNLVVSDYHYYYFPNPVGPVNLRPRGTFLDDETSGYT